ncbi:cupin domain-containing protein [Pseudomonas akapageensis]|uniref:cupin domain-containing protein n=1 Tax=Pseudomonas akapageensis TaxID=2609961 RepID=UPI00140E12D2|nr:cupin domain-containing protein [Pseudomonas akapageensis]
MLHYTKTARQFSETGFPGIRSSAIWGENGNGSDFIEFKAGARFPLHDHEGQEEVLILSGRIRMGDLVMEAGDYLKIGPGEEHDAEALEDTLFFLVHLGGIVIKE